MQVPFHGSDSSYSRKGWHHAFNGKTVSNDHETQGQVSQTASQANSTSTTSALDLQSIPALLNSTNSSTAMAVIMSLLIQMLLTMQQNGQFQVGNLPATVSSDSTVLSNRHPHHGGVQSSNHSISSGNTDTSTGTNASTSSSGAGSANAVTTAGAVRAVNGRLVDANGNNTVLKGYNVWTANGATLADSRLNSVRVNMADWNGAERDTDAFVVQVKAYAEANPGKTVILGYRSENSAGDINQTRLLSSQQVTEGTEFWQTAAASLKDTPNVVFNLENELGLGQEDNAEVYGYYEKWIPAIRSTGATNPIMIGSNYHGNGGLDGQTGDFLVEYGAKLKALDSEHNIIGSIHPYSAHSYDRLVNLIQNIKDAAGIPVVADEIGEQYGDPNAPAIVEQVAIDGYLDGMLFWGGADLQGDLDEQNYAKNWQPFLESLSKFSPT